MEGNVIRGFIQLVTKEGVSGWTEGVYKGMNDEVMEFSKSQVNSWVMGIYGGKALKGT